MTREELLKIKERLEGGVNSSDPTENAVVMHALLESHLAALEQVEKLKKMAKRPRSLRTPKTEAEWERWLQGRTR